MRVAAISIALLLGVAGARAQPMSGAHSSAWRTMRAQHEQEMMTDLHTVLRIRPDQEPAFQAFAAAMHASDRMPPEMEDMERLTTPQIIDRMDASKAAHDAEERRRGAAVKAFYAALSGEQRQVFDALHRLTMGHGGWGMHGRHGPPS